MQITSTPYPTNRIAFIDYMRGFLFLLMALDHALHAYAFNWAPFWFFRDYDRTVILDGLYLFNQTIIMPGVFFTFGIYALEHYKSGGAAKFWRDRFIKFGIPFIVGVPLIVPLLCYPKFNEYVDANPSLWDYWSEIFFTERLQAGPFWVMYALLLYSGLLLALNAVFLRVVPWLARHIKAAVAGKLTPIVGFTLFSIVTFTVSDFIWGAPWWIGFWKLFYLQGSKFIMNFVYFILGAAFMHSRVFEERSWVQFSRHKIKFLLLTLGIGGLYGWYVTAFYKGAFDDSLRHMLYQGYSFTEAFHQFTVTGPKIMGRTALLGILLLSQICTLLTFFSAIQQESKSPKSKAFWNFLALNAWGLFIFHEVIVVWLQYWFINYNLAIILKIMVEFIVGSVVSLFVTQQLRRIPYIKQVFDIK
jgi:Acyltransferase family